jgi:hypothetical protein
MMHLDHLLSLLKLTIRWDSSLDLATHDFADDGRHGRQRFTSRSPYPFTLRALKLVRETCDDDDVAESVVVAVGRGRLELPGADADRPSLLTSVAFMQILHIC